VAAALPGRRVAMGFGNGVRYESTWVRPDLVRAGHPYAIEPVALMDLQAEGVAIPADRFFEASDVDVWLTPRGQDPFVMRSFYGAPHILSDEFREHFTRHWHITGNSQFFAFWERKADVEQAPLAAPKGVQP